MSALVNFHARFLQPDAVGIRSAAAGDQNMRRFERASPRAQPHRLAGLPLDAFDRGSGPDVDLLVAKQLPDRRGDVRILLMNERGIPLDHGHAAAEAPEGLGQFRADIAAPQHDEMLGQFA